MIIYLPKTPISIDDVKIVTSPEFSFADASTQSTIDTLWNEEVEQAKQQGKQLFDDPVASFKDYKVTSVDNRSHLELSTTKLSFRTRYIAKKHPEIGQSIGPLSAMFTHVLLRTTDNYYIFGKKSGHFVTDLTDCFIGGAFPYDSDLTSHVYQELAEEIGTEKETITGLDVCGIYRNAIGNVGIVVAGDALFGSKELKKEFDRWNATQNTPELESITLVPESGLVAFLQTAFGNYQEVRSIMESSLTA